MQRSVLSESKTRVGAPHILRALWHSPLTVPLVSLSERVAQKLFNMDIDKMFKVKDTNRVTMRAY
jgi:hypothetical protein